MAGANSFVGRLTSFQPGERLVDGGDCLALANLVSGTVSGLTAHAGGAAASGTRLNVGLSEADTVASAADSFRLPPAVPGSICYLYNAAANDCQVFGLQANQSGGLAAGDQIIPYNSNVAAAVATGVAHASHVVGIYMCFKIGLWKQFLSQS